MATFVALTAVVLAAILHETGGILVYSLDDAYIHLALAERMRLGHYGLNLGEVSAPSSSIIWPFLLVPAAATWLGPITPLILNFMFGAVTAYLLGRLATSIRLPIEWSSNAAARFRLAIAVLLVVACNLVTLAFTGLEHSLQVLIAVTLALVCVEHADNADLPSWTLLIAAAGPAIRYEMFALTAAIALLLICKRRYRQALVLCGASLIAPCLFSIFLVLNGNYPLPNSVIAKLLNPHAFAPHLADSSLLSLTERLERAARRFLTTDLTARLTLIASIAILGWQWRTAGAGRRNLLACGILAGILHLVVGQFGWWYRYEVYVIAFCLSITVVTLAERLPLAAAGLLVLASTHYLPSVVRTPLAARNIHEQQYQMHRFVADHYRKPFAVNDIGWVSIGLGGSTYVLDLWGLASAEALVEQHKTPEWLDRITRRHETGLAMMYPNAFEQVPASWTKVGELQLTTAPVSVPHRVVGIYATAAGDTNEIAQALAAFAPLAPNGVLLLPSSKVD